MYLCLCHGVTDYMIKRLVSKGARNIKDIKTACRAGSSCGSCVCSITKVLECAKKDVSNNIVYSKNVYSFIREITNKFFHTL